MLGAATAAVVALLSEILPMIGTASQVGKVIAILVEIVPTLVKVAEDLVQPVKNIIAALQNNPATTADQLAQLKELDAKVDTDFEAAATAATAEDSAAGQ